MHIDQATLNIAQLEERLGGDRELIAEVSQMLFEDAPRLADGCRTALAVSDAEGASRAAHTLKGAAANLCAGAVCGVADRIERLARDGDLAAARHACTLLLDEVDKLGLALKAVIESSPG
jgi:two-component system sensor histidine kinase/response regulator